MRLEIIETGGEKASGHMRMLADRAGNPAPAFSRIADLILGRERRLFESPGARWPKLKDATIDRKARSKDARVRANANRRLVATGRLERFLTTRAMGAQPILLNRHELHIGIPAGRHDVFYGRFQKGHGRDPLVSRRIVTTVASPVIREFLTGTAVGFQFRAR